MCIRDRYKPLRKNLGKKNCELSPQDIQRIVDVFLRFEESAESKIFDNAAFGYWKVTIERPLRLSRVDPERSYTPKEIKALKVQNGVDESGRPVIRKIVKGRDANADSLRGRFDVMIGGKPCVVELSLIHI